MRNDYSFFSLKINQVKSSENHSHDLSILNSRGTSFLGKLLNFFIYFDQTDERLLQFVWNQSSNKLLTLGVLLRRKYQNGLIFDKNQLLRCFDSLLQDWSEIFFHYFKTHPIRYNLKTFRHSLRTFLHFFSRSRSFWSRILHLEYLSQIWFSLNFHSLAKIKYILPNMLIHLLA